MRTHIDWLTFTMRPVYRSSYPEGTTNDEVYADGIRGAYETTFDSETARLVFGGVWVEAERSRAPYSDAWTLKDGGITLFASPTLPHCCVEISGTGCERLLSINRARDVLYAVHDRCTRIDIACDIETDISPIDFVAEVSHERMRASGTQISETGTTCYVGSQKSDRYARVYRYNAPHPRAHLLRVEHVFRKDYAKEVAKRAANGDYDALAIAAGAAFGWCHPIWDTSGADVERISIVSGERSAGKTVFWLINSVAPAFKKACETGAITNPDAFIREYFYPDYSPYA